MKEFIKTLKERNIYAITSRSDINKTDFCLSLASHILENNDNILYLSNFYDVKNIKDYIATLPSSFKDNITFKQIFRLHRLNLKAFINQKQYKYLILDPFDNYSLYIDCSELKEIAVENSLIVILTKNISKPPIFSRRKSPALSDIKFCAKNVRQTFLAYTDMIMFLSKNSRAFEFSVLVAKNSKGSIGTTINLK